MMDKRKMLLCCCLLVMSVLGYSQLRINSQGIATLEKDLQFLGGENNGLLLGRSKLYSHNFATYFLNNNGGFRMDEFGKIKLVSSDCGFGVLKDTVNYTFDSPFIHVDPWFYDSTLFIRSIGSRPIHTSLYSDLFGSPREGIRSDVSLITDKAFAAYLGGGGGPYSGLVFSVNGQGLVYASSGLAQASDGRLKENIKTITSASERLNSLRGVLFSYKKDQKNVRLSDNPDMYISDEVEKQIKSEQKLPRIGLVAQEVEVVVPEVVRTLPDGTKTIMYTDLIPLLIENIKELNKSLEEQNEKISILEDMLNASPEYKKQQTKTAIQQQDVFLYQNTPNPFNQETEIKYQIPSNVSASICIYNLSGLQLKKYPLTETNGKIVVSASEFSAGIYIYSLIVNNQEVDSKRMILTN